MSFFNDFTLSNIHYVAVNLREIALDHREQRCVLRMGFASSISRLYLR